MILNSGFVGGSGRGSELCRWVFRSNGLVLWSWGGPTRRIMLRTVWIGNLDRGGKLRCGLDLRILRDARWPVEWPWGLGVADTGSL